MGFLSKSETPARRQCVHEFTPDGLMIAYGIGAAFAVGILYVLFRTVG